MSFCYLIINLQIIRGGPVFQIHMGLSWIYYKFIFFTLGINACHNQISIYMLWYLKCSKYGNRSLNLYIAIFKENKVFIYLFII